MELKFKTIIIGIAILFLIFLTGAVIYFNATLVDKRVTEPINATYSVRDTGFLIESGVLTGRSWIDGNQIEILDRGETIFQSMYDDIANAQKSITKETFNYFGEKVGTPMAEALADASNRGVSVHFLMDFIGSVLASSEKFEIMEGAGVEVERWREPSWYQLSRFNHRTHRKLLIIDGEAAYTGGVNTADLWLPDLEEGGYRDYHFRITGPVVNDIQGAFSENWLLSRGVLLNGEKYYPELDATGDLRMQVSSGNPREGDLKLRKMLLYAMASSRESVRIGSAYFFPDQKFLEKLIQTADRGVKIQILTPGENIDQNYVRLASQSRWGGLLEAGIEIYEYQPAMYHAKKMIVDDYFVSIGSTNFDNRSFRLNDETNVNIVDDQFGQEMAALFDYDLNQSTVITLEEWSGRPVWKKVYGWLIAKLLGPYL
jgi:cardiolipin synthase A/B